MAPRTAGSSTTFDSNSTDSKPVLISEFGELVKGQEKKLAVRLMEFKGHRYLDIRMLNLEGQRWSYGHGITVGKRIFTQFLSLLNQENLELGLNAEEVEP